MKALSLALLPSAASAIVLLPGGIPVQNVICPPWSRPIRAEMGLFDDLMRAADPENVMGRKKEEKQRGGGGGGFEPPKMPSLPNPFASFGQPTEEPPQKKRAPPKKQASQDLDEMYTGEPAGFELPKMDLPKIDLPKFPNPFGGGD